MWNRLGRLCETCRSFEVFRAALCIADDLRYPCVDQVMAALRPGSGSTSLLPPVSRWAHLIELEEDPGHES